ncbi:universal stress protein [Streptomyces sp. NPDC002845]
MGTSLTPEFWERFTVLLVLVLVLVLAVGVVCVLTAAFDALPVRLLRHRAQAGGAGGLPVDDRGGRLVRRLVSGRALREPHGAGGRNDMSESRLGGQGIPAPGTAAAPVRREGPPGVRAGAARPEPRTAQYRARRVLRGVSDRLAERYPRLYIAAEQVRLPPGPALLAEAQDAELLVIGSRGFGGVGGLLSGSVALATVARTGRPVVLVRAGETLRRPNTCLTCPAGPRRVRPTVTWRSPWTSG